jgi:hypothetical protein
MSKAFFDVQDVVNSLRFYLMLGIVCKQNGSFVGDPEFQLKNFLKELKEDSQYNEDKIKRYTKVACDTLPSEFLKIYNIENINRR